MDSEPVKRIGQPPMELTPEIEEALFSHLEDGGSLRGFCAMDGNPSRTTVHKWLRNNEPFANHYAAARARGMDTWAEEIVEIADESGLDVIGVNLNTGQPVVDGEAIARSRLRVDARKWIMSKLAPKKYGEKVEVEHGGEQKHTITFRRG